MQSLLLYIRSWMERLGPADKGFSRSRGLSPGTPEFLFLLLFLEQFTTSYLLPKTWRAGYHAENVDSAKRAAELCKVSSTGWDKGFLLPIRPHLRNKSNFPDYGFSQFSDLSTLLNLALLQLFKATVFQLY